MPSKLEIANQALASIGISAPIANFDERSNEAAQIRLHYATAVQAVLESAHWNFARAQVALTLLGDVSLGDSVPAPWFYKYAYPADSAQIRYVMPAASPTSPSLPSPGVRPVRFVVGVDVDASGNESKVILCNEPQAQAVYTRSIKNEAMFDVQFAITLSAYLGHLVCMPLTNDPSRGNASYQRANNASVVAQASNGDEGLTVIDSTPDWIRARSGDCDLNVATGTSGYVNWPTPLVPAT